MFLKETKTILKLLNPERPINTGLSIHDKKMVLLTQTLSVEVVEAKENTPPEISEKMRTTAVVGRTYLSQLDIDDESSGSLSFSLVGPDGMTVDSRGAIAWTPTPAQLGNQTVSVTVTDSEGATSQIEFTINVSHRDVNRPPSITSVPKTIALREDVYRYPLEATDPDGDFLIWNLESGPRGMVVDEIEGMLSWQPSLTQIGDHTVTVTVLDARGLLAGQEYTLTVRGGNTPPELVSTPITVAAVDVPYSYQVVATDLENDSFSFSLSKHPEGMAIDSATGVIFWTPQESQTGTQEVEITVVDSRGAASTQSYNISVGTNAINTAPEITSTPVLYASPGKDYNYQVEAEDPDGDDLNFIGIAWGQEKLP